MHISRPIVFFSGNKRRTYGRATFSFVRPSHLGQRGGPQPYDRVIGVLFCRCFQDSISGDPIVGGGGIYTSTALPPRLESTIQAGCCVQQFTTWMRAMPSRRPPFGLMSTASKRASSLSRGILSLLTLRCVDEGRDEIDQ